MGVSTCFSMEMELAILQLRIRWIILVSSPICPYFKISLLSLMRNGNPIGMVRLIIGQTWQRCSRPPQYFQTHSKAIWVYYFPVKNLKQHEEELITFLRQRIHDTSPIALTNSIA